MLDCIKFWWPCQLHTMSCVRLCACVLRVISWKGHTTGSVKWNSSMLLWRNEGSSSANISIKMSRVLLHWPGRRYDLWPHTAPNRWENQHSEMTNKTLWREPKCNISKHCITPRLLRNSNTCSFFNLHHCVWINVYTSNTETSRQQWQTLDQSWWINANSMTFDFSLYCPTLWRQGSNVNWFQRGILSVSRHRLAELTAHLVVTSGYTIDSCFACTMCICCR